MTSYKNMKGIIFDLDGTLADTQLNFAAMCREVGVAEGTPLLEYCNGLKDRHRASHIQKVIEEHELAGAHNAQWIDDAQTALNAFIAADIPLAIVTRNMRRAAQITIKKLSIPIETVITREDCKPKPDPEGLLKVAEHWRMQASDIIYVGDFKFDLLAAKNAGMMSCLKSNERNQIYHHLADKVIHRFEELTSIVL